MADWLPVVKVGAWGRWSKLEEVCAARDAIWWPVDCVCVCELVCDCACNIHM